MSKNTYFFVIFCHFLGLFWQLVTTPHNQIVRKSEFVSAWNTGSCEQKFLKKNIWNGPSLRMAVAENRVHPLIFISICISISYANVMDAIQDWQIEKKFTKSAKIKFVTNWYSGTYKVNFPGFLLQFRTLYPKKIKNKY